MSHKYFKIQADDVERASIFYGKIFGWKFHDNSHAPVEYLRIETGGTVGGILKLPADTPPSECGTNTFVCSIQADDFDVISDKILKHDGKVALSKFSITKTCWQGYFMDTEGNTFGLFEVDENAD